MKMILMIEKIDIDEIIIRELKDTFGTDIEFQKVSIEEVFSIEKIGDALFVTTLQALGKNKQEIMDALELLSRMDNFKLLVGEIPESFKRNPNFSLIITQSYKVLAYADYCTRKINQKKKLAELKGDGEKIEGYGRPNKVTMQEFIEIYVKVIDRTITNLEAQNQLNLSKRSYYKYKEKYEKEYTNVLH